MPLYKFGPGDVFYNVINTHPSSSFYIQNSKVFYQNKSTEPGSFVSNVNGVPVGNVSLFELNVDRAVASTGRVIGPSSSSDPTQNVTDNGTIYPFVYKGEINGEVGFKNDPESVYINNFATGDVITGSYFMSSSLTRRVYGATAGFNDTNKDGAALRNSLDFAKRLGPHYDFPSGSSTNTNVIYIPSIFYGSEIKKGTVDLKFFITGTLIGRCRDSRYDGALLMDSAALDGTATDKELVGVVLYKEGAIILGNVNGSAPGNLGPATALSSAFRPQFSQYNNRANTTTQNAAATFYNWRQFGMGLPQGHSPSLERNPTQHFLQSASFAIDFAGTHKVPTITMLANANRGELNYTNNPTYIEYGQTAFNPVTSSTFYGEQALDIKNIHSASYSDPTGSLKKTTYITKIGIYDDDKNLIGIASVAKPVKKTEERDLTFKLKLDI